MVVPRSAWLAGASVKRPSPEDSQVKDSSLPARRLVTVTLSATMKAA